MVLVTSGTHGWSFLDLSYFHIQSQLQSLSRHMWVLKYTGTTIFTQICIAYIVGVTFSEAKITEENVHIQHALDNVV